MALLAAGKWADRHLPGKPWVFGLSLLPLVFLVIGAALDRLGSNPAETLIRTTGDWTLRFLCLTLLVTPLRVALKLTRLAVYRRMLGLYCFFYGTLHLLCYAALDMGLDWPSVSKDIAKRPFILVGFSAFVILIALALTSWDGAIRRLGGRRWQWLHRGVYLVAPLAVLHFFWMRAGKNNFAEVWWYAGVLAVLMAWRVFRRFGHFRS
jgi:sulfoxide reductase heme-binding subunit YedZ